MHTVTSALPHKKIAALRYALATLFFSAVLLPLGAADAPAATAAPADCAGAWDGEVTLEGQAVHIRIDLQATPAAATDPAAASGDTPPPPSPSTKTTVKSTTTAPADTNRSTPATINAKPPMPLTWTGTFTARQEAGSHPLEKLRFTADTLTCETVVDGARLRFHGARNGRTLTGEVLFLTRAGDTAKSGAFRVTGPPALAAANAAPKPGTTFAGDWEGTVRPVGAAATTPGTPLWMSFTPTDKTWQGTLYIKSREPGAAFEKITVEGKTLHAEATLEGQRIRLEGTLENAALQGTLTAQPIPTPAGATTPAANAERPATQRAVWSAKPAARSGFQPPPVEPIAAHENPATPRPLEPETGLPVFPGAQGFGTRTPAGRGGAVIEVTTLADNGPGSLRAALTTPGPRTIVFRVGGVITAEDFLYVSEPFITVAGETAPGDGLCIAGAGLVITTHDVLISHLRIRPGNQGNIEPAHNDALCVLGDRKLPGNGAHHIVLDHLSASWSEDECLSIWGGATDVTVSWCLIGEALSQSRHHKDTHSAGLLVGDSSDHVSMHHNLLLHNGFRNPLISLGGTHEFVNNVVYNWQEAPAEIYDLKSNTFFNFIGNTYLKGPSTQSAARALVVPAGRDKGQPKIFAADNADPHRATATTDTANDAWRSVGGDWQGGPADLKLRAPAPFTTRGLKADTAQEAYPKILAGAGALRPRRDSVDARLVRDVTNRTGKIINSPADVGGLPAYKTVAAADLPADSDHDGIPDAWELAHALDSHNKADGNQDRNKDGYTNLEEFLHSLR